MSKVVNDLLGFNLKIVQDTEWFSFSLDSVLLSHFVTINKNTKNILDMGTGNIPIPLFLSTRCNAHITGVEIQKDCCMLANETIKINKLDNRITVINEDIKNLKKYFSDGYFDVIVSNPPFFTIDSSNKKSVDNHKLIARHEVFINLKDLIKMTSFLLKNKGIFAMVHRTDRLSEILKTLEDNRLFVKRIKFVYSKDKTNSNMVLIECVKNGKRGLKVLAPTIIHNTDGSYKDEIKKLFDGGSYESKKF